MHMGVFVKSLFSCLILIPAFVFAASSEEAVLMHGAPEPHVLLKKGEAGGPLGGGQSPQLSYHQGPVLPHASIYSIFWGSEWSNATFAGDKISGMNRFFNGFSGSQYAHTTNEYYDSTGSITALSTYQGSSVDLTVAPARAPKVSALVAEVCKLTNNSPDSNGVYFVYTSTKAGNVNYCAWHSWGNCPNGAKVQVAYMPNLDGVAGCDTQDNASGNSQGLAAIANVTAHELVEAITDPRGNAWFDNSGQENADKCAWSFPSANNGLSTFSDGSRWKIQMTWSNSAYSTSSGSANRSGQLGCIY
jgi:hypothetical protein